MGHLFQERYKAILVDADSYLLELFRYVVLNPVRAGMVGSVRDWPWSSYLAMLGEAEAPEWLETDGLLAAFGKRRAYARRRYAAFVAAGVGQPCIWSGQKRQVYLGDDAFAAKIQRKAGDSEDVNVPRARRCPPAPSLAAITRKHRNRDASMVAAHATGEHSYQQIAEHSGVHFSTVGRVVRQAKSP